MKVINKSHSPGKGSASWDIFIASSWWMILLEFLWFLSSKRNDKALYHHYLFDKEATVSHFSIFYA